MIDAQSILLLIFFALLGSVLCKKTFGRASLVREVLDETLSVFQEKVVVKASHIAGSAFTEVREVCHNFLNTADYGRVGCCVPNDIKHLYNVMIENRKLIFFRPDSSSPGLGTLPPVSTVKAQKKHNFNLPIEYRDGPLIPSKHCTRYFNGTLHIPGRSTVHNVYHALGDNVLPLIGQIILDVHYAPDLLYNPRAILTNFGPQQKDPIRQVSERKGGGRQVGSMGGGDESVTVHMRLMEDIMSNGSIPFNHVNGMCFRRIAWGHGPHMFYVVALQRLRRLVGRFSYLFAKKLLEVYIRRGNHIWHRWGEQDAVSDNLVSPQQRLVNSQGQPLKVLVYTRGSSGRGRTIQNEDLIIKALRERGAEAFICCNYQNTTLEQQLYYATNADMIIGMHGAAMTHGIFMAPGTIALELKTLYAIDSILFPLITDGHIGIHGQVNIRKYFVPGGQKPIDAPLIARLMSAVEKALEMQKKLSLTPTAGKVIVSRNHSSMCDKAQLIDHLPSKIKGDMILGPACETKEMSHMLGPQQSTHEKWCKSSLFQNWREEMESKEEGIHCRICDPYVLG